MPRGQYIRKTKITAPQVTGIVKAEAFTALPWWKKLSNDEQKSVISEGQQLAQSLLHYGQSRVAIGEHLTSLRNVLEPHKLFERFLKNFHFSKRTAYRYIAGYENAKSRLPQSILNAAMARGVQIIGDNNTKPLGIYTAAAERLHPPKEATEVQANTYLDQLEQVRKQVRSEAPVNLQALPVGDPTTLAKECLRFVTTRYKRLPQNKRTREAWARQLVGMMLSEFGIGTAQTFAPQLVPDNFRVQRGRPKTATQQIAATA